jgi:glutathione synthase/RimK-type ligase-like ATP-grasp enzyme
MKVFAVLLSNDATHFSFKGNKPFKRSILNKSYSNFAKIGSKNGFKVIFSKWNNVSFETKSKPLINRYWFFDNGWKKSFDFIQPNFFFDKFDSGEKQNVLRKKLSNRKKIINSFEMEIFCKDKFAQSKIFSKISPKTFLVKNNNDFEKNVKKLKSEIAILKPRFGLGGKGITVFNINKIPTLKISEDFVLQELIDSSGGIPKMGIKGVHDLRCLILNGKIIFSYVREPKRGFLANIHQGGTAKIISTPSTIRKYVKQIDFYVKKFGNRFYSADFIYGSYLNKNSFFLVELNSKPGFDVCCKFGYEKEEKKLFQEIFELGDIFG